MSLFSICQKRSSKASHLFVSIFVAFFSPLYKIFRMELTLDCNDERPGKEDGPDGYSAATIFTSPAGCQGLTYDDIILMPGEPCFSACGLKECASQSRQAVVMSR